MDLFILDVDRRDDERYVSYTENIAKTCDNETQVINYIAKIAAGDIRDKVNKIIKLDITSETVTRMDVQLDQKTLKLKLVPVPKEGPAQGLEDYRSI